MSSIRKQRKKVGEKRERKKTGSIGQAGEEKKERICYMEGGWIGMEW